LFYIKLFYLRSKIIKTLVTHEKSLEQYHEQLEYVLSNYQSHGLKQGDFKNIVIGGLGGSGIGAKLAQNWFYRLSEIPINVVNDYHLPNFVNENTLVILQSYSGNTEETLNLFSEAKEKGARIIVLASGGKLEDLAKKENYTFYSLVKGFQPRQTIGYGLSFLTLILGELIGIDYSDEIQKIAEEIKTNQDRRIDSANTIFNFFKSSIQQKFVILCDRAMEPVAIRFAQQINENSKLEAFVQTIPEHNHNVLESYTDKLASNFIFIYTSENERVASRFEFLQGHLELDNNSVLPLYIPEYSLMTIYDMIYRTDWVSVFFANELDAALMEVPMISQLKEYLANLND
tara:strand:- start:1021 stop:2055 length:1035 start_codon:yes stop_codon:yes gene_type:complete